VSAKLLGKALAATMPTHVAKLVLVVLCDAAEPDGTSVYPSIARIAAFAQCKPRHVKRILKLFREALFPGDRRLIRVVRPGGAGPGATTEYAIDVGLLHDLEAQGWGRLVLAVPPEGPLDDEPGDGEGGDSGENSKGDTRTPLEGDLPAPMGDLMTPLEGDRAAHKGDIAVDKGDSIVTPDPPSRPVLSDPVERERARAIGQEGDPLPDVELLDRLRRRSPTVAHDGRVETEAEWRRLSGEERAKAERRYAGWLELAGKRTAIAGLPRYLRERLFDFVSEPGGSTAGATGQATGGSTSIAAFSRPWWQMVHRYLATHGEALNDQRSPAAGTLRNEFAKAVKGLGYSPRDEGKRAEIEAAAAALVHVRKDDPAVRRWLKGWADRGVKIPLPDQVDWIFVPRELLDARALAGAGQGGNGNGA
jgi:hypothetical protein